jgi:hypothetical protein
VRLILACLLMWPLLVGAVARDLDDCTIGSTPTALAPLDLDNCTINDGDDITGILTGLASTYGDVYVRAPSETLSVISKTITITTATDFVFLEDQSAANRLTITHDDATDQSRMWRITNATEVRVGGPNLGMTLIGTHEGLGVAVDSGAKGLIELVLDNATNPALADIRANFHKTWHSGIVVRGGANGSTAETTASRFQQVNIAGRFLSSGVNIQGGAMDVWADPDRTVVMDPWVRVNGWDGAVAQTDSGVPIGCMDTDRLQYAAVVFYMQDIRRITGGVTLEYGGPNASIFLAKYIGNGANDPYIVRIKDFGFSGPLSMTGYPSGTMVRKAYDITVMKHDPLPLYGLTGQGSRHIRFTQLPATYGNGMRSNSITGACAVGNETVNTGASGTPLIWRGEASRDGQAGQFITAFVDVTFDGVTEWEQMENGTNREYAQASGYQPDDSPGPSDPDRSYGHVLRASQRTNMPGIVAIHDTDTVTGPGSWYQIGIAGRVTNNSTVINAKDNAVTDTHVHGTIVIGDNSTGTVVDNVDFTGSARAIITVASGADVTVTDLCVPNGSTITGTGTLTYEGSSESLPYTIPNGTSNCSITADPSPGPVTGGGVE